MPPALPEGGGAITMESWETWARVSTQEWNPCARHGGNNHPEPQGLCLTLFLTIEK